MKKLILIGAYFLIAGCASVVMTVKPSNVEVKDNGSAIDTLSTVSKLVDPYRDSVNDQMGEIIATAETDFLVRRKPSGNLSNWVADAVLVNQTKNKRLSEPVMCLLNTGGIRSAIPQGNVTIGDMYKVMPFDNEVVWVRMPMESLPDIHKYILNRGGDPIANAIVTSEKIELSGRIDRHTSFWIITSDYLVNGGDNMNFFSQSTERINTGVLLRTVLIEEARYQGVLINDTTNRMLF